MQAGLEMRIEQENWKEAAKDAGNLSELYLTSGDVSRAIDYACQSVDFADRSGDKFQKWSKRGRLAVALHQSNNLSESIILFKDAETISKSHTGHKYLYSDIGFYYCDLLISQGKVQAVLERTEHMIEIAIRNKWLLDTAMDKLSLGRAYLLEALRLRSEQALTPPSIPPQGGKKGVPPQGRKMDVSSRGGEKGVPTRELVPDLIREGNKRGVFSQAQDYLNQAVDGMREANRQDYLPRALFARTLFYRVQNEFPKAWDDLEEAREIAERGEMKLWLVDYHLEACRLCLAQVSAKSSAGARFIVPFEGYERIKASRKQIIGEARKHVEKAENMIDKMGYHRRDPEVELCYAGVCFAERKKTKTREYLNRAKKTLKKMGIRMWDWEVERLEERLKS
jgi:tetratricopeptide (TPR) repeat protein